MMYTYLPSSSFNSYASKSEDIYNSKNLTNYIKKLQHKKLIGIPDHYFTTYLLVINFRYF
jgi:hypothetical protein